MPLFGQVRWDAIMARLGARNAVRVGELAATLGISPECIRRDLARPNGAGFSSACMAAQGRHRQVVLTGATLHPAYHITMGEPNLATLRAQRFDLAESPPFA